MASHPLRPLLSAFPWIAVHQAPPDPLAPTTLDAGEAEALALARAAHGRLLIIDELRGRSAARQLGLPISGSVGMLLEAKSIGLIPFVRPYLDQMKVQGRYIGPKLLSQALSLSGE
jgi:predicted nucleic acid-binding protein